MLYIVLMRMCFKLDAIDLADLEVFMAFSQIRL